MSIENGKCPNCGGGLKLDSAKEKATCLYCGSELMVQQAVQKIVIEGIATFDALLLSAQEAMKYDHDYDKARDKYKQALDLKPHDYRVLWGLYVCEIEGIKWAKYYHGYVQFPGDVFENVLKAIQKYGMRAYENAPQEIKPYYYRCMEYDKENIKDDVEKEKKKKGCYIATSVYGSYDCPEVWVLRRYRDFNLDEKLTGKIFIRLYYKISPILVKIFGKNERIKRQVKKVLDKKVLKLKLKGYGDKPYKDKM